MGTDAVTGATSPPPLAAPAGASSRQSNQDAFLRDANGTRKAGANSAAPSNTAGGSARVGNAVPTRGGGGPAITPGAPPRPQSASSPMNSLQ